MHHQAQASHALALCSTHKHALSLRKLPLSQSDWRVDMNRSCPCLKVASVCGCEQGLGAGLPPKRGPSLPARPVKGSASAPSAARPSEAAAQLPPSGLAERLMGAFGLTWDSPPPAAPSRAPVRTNGTIDSTSTPPPGGTCQKRKKTLWSLRSNKARKKHRHACKGLNAS